MRSIGDEDEVFVVCFHRKYFRFCAFDKEYLECSRENLFDAFRVDYPDMHGSRKIWQVRLDSSGYIF